MEASEIWRAQLFFEKSHDRGKPNSLAFVLFAKTRSLSPCVSDREAKDRLEISRNRFGWCPSARWKAKNGMKIRHVRNRRKED